MLGKNIGWQLADKRIWDVDNATFASREGLTITPSPVDTKGAHSLEGLVEALDFYGLPKGELASQEELRANFAATIQKYLDDFAKTRLYDNIHTAAVYASSTNPPFAEEGKYAVEAMSQVWTAAYALQAEVLAGARPMPTDEELITLLPKLEWPTARSDGM